jgi:hypothetical protein
MHAIQTLGAAMTLTLAAATAQAGGLRTADLLGQPSDAARTAAVQQLVKYGVPADAAQARVASLSADEVQRLRIEVGSAPAAGKVSSGTWLVLIGAGVYVYMTYK